MSFLSPEANLNHPVLIFYEKTHCFPTEIPHLGEFGDAEVALECDVLF
jgi:hypothetical protein